MPACPSPACPQKLQSWEWELDKDPRFSLPFLYSLSSSLSTVNLKGFAWNKRCHHGHGFWCFWEKSSALGWVLPERSPSLWSHSIWSSTLSSKWLNTFYHSIFFVTCRLCHGCYAVDTFLCNWINQQIRIDLCVLFKHTHIPSSSSKSRTLVFFLATHRHTINNNRCSVLCSQTHTTNNNRTSMFYSHAHHKK